MIEQEEENPKDKLRMVHLFGKKYVGRPPAYNDPQEMHEKIFEYLEWEEKASKGKYTIEGCALWLGFASRQSIYDYEKKSPEFAYIMGKFNLFMSHYHAQGLKWAGSFQGSQFWLKNFGGYKDEVIQHQHQTLTKVEPQVINGAPPLADDHK